VSEDTESDRTPPSAVTTAFFWGSIPSSDAAELADQALRAIPDGWAKVGGKWVRLEPRKITHWRVVDDVTGGISYDPNSRDEGRLGLTHALHWLRKMRDRDCACHLEIWEEAWWDTPTTWRRVNLDAEGR
jgi:hypothetical protein